ncbi:RNA dependent RNA polymerase [Halobacillus litoralis]|uniref:RNA dependent RNA polymerase n=1 Tax=Halobacillus litoralis TaxID=45668 RepID=UPI001CD6475C|nr:hypothetical protein [Halobacillus litoralis]MCA1021625.1 hypothetical protein [Halobacillus litoralis]
MQTNQLLTFKFNSSRLNEFDFNIELSIEEAKEYGEAISLFDNQILRSIREIKGQNIDFEEMNRLHAVKKKLKRKGEIEEAHRIESYIDETLYVPEYITIVIDSNKHYEYLFRHGLKLNNQIYRRFSCSASQARNSTVVFVDESVSGRLNEILDNGRNLNKELVPSKFNAYKGLSGSSTETVSTPRFCVVPDYFSPTDVTANFVTETGKDDDDMIVQKTFSEDFNRFDGQGLISYEMAAQWAEELNLDYVPAQWCIRENYVKGMLNTFAIHEFCEKKNNGNYLIDTIYKDSNGDPVKVDLREIDVILTESQHKLWDSWESIESYKDNCLTNNLHWGVTLHSPKKDKDILKMNYQFLQTLDLNKDDIEEICKKFVNWVNGVTSENVYYTMLFLLGKDVDEEKFADFLNRGENFWIKSLIVDPEMIKDKYIKKKVHDLLKRKIKSGCLGEIILDGNFQTLVSDPYAMMEYVCGKEVKGLLGRREYYSNYWNMRNVAIVNSMRSPLTYRSEHVLLNLVDNSEANYWYRHNYTGIIVNIHGHETMNWAGSDFDYDIIATTSDKTVISSVFQDELPVVYDPPKAEKTAITEEKLYKSDLFSFGSIIGQITNRSTIGFALLPYFEEGSEEHNAIMKRIQMCTKLQSAQIDKAKIGREVKGIPKPWSQFQKIYDEDTEDIKKKKEFQNQILMDKHPYFFIYAYKNTKKKYGQYVKRNDITCKQKFGLSLDELKNLHRKTVEQKDFLKSFYRYSPVIESDCVMNNLCKHIESIDFGIKRLVKSDNDILHVRKLMSNDIKDINQVLYQDVVSIYNQYKKTVSQKSSLTGKPNKGGFDDETYSSILYHYQQFEKDLFQITSDIRTIVDCLIWLFYIESPRSNKDVLWSIFGEYIYENVLSKINEYHIPVNDPNGEIEYLGSKYSLKRVGVNNV